MQRADSNSWPGKSNIVPRTLIFSNHVVKAGMKTTGKVSPVAREPIVNRTKNTSEINRELINENRRCYYAKNKKQIRQSIVQSIMCFGAWDQEAEKLEVLGQE